MKVYQMTLVKWLEGGKKKKKTGQNLNINSKFL